MQIQVETVRVRLGIATRASLNNLISQRDVLRLQIDIINETFRLKSQFIGSRVGRPGYEFIRDYTIPETIPSLGKTLNQIVSGLLSNNPTLVTNRQQLSTLQNRIFEMRNMPDVSASAIRSLQLQIDNLTLQTTLLEQQLTLTAQNRWTAYENARLQYESRVAERQTLEHRLNLIDRMFSVGLISRLEHMTQTHSVNEELFSAKSAAITLMNLIVELDFMSQGVVGG